MVDITILEMLHEAIVANGISKDTRTIEEGQVYIALDGETFDGHDYIDEALEKGALFVISERSHADDRVVQVPDTLSFLGELALYHRSKFDIPVIAITGSNGKTTTKELIAAALQTKYKTHKSMANMNNHIGVPFTLLAMPLDAEAAVIEMGANHAGEIAGLCEMVRPTHGLVTNLGHDHVGMYGGFEASVKAQAELYEYAQQRDMMVFVDANDERLMELSSENKRELYEKVEAVTDGYATISFVCDGQVHSTNLFGEFNAQNIGAALAVAQHLGVDVENACKAIASYQPTLSRSQVIEGKHNTIIADHYNANRESMIAALHSLANIKTEQTKIAILGDMFELGEYAQEEHGLVVQHANSLSGVTCYFIGQEFATHGDAFTDVTAAIEYFKQNPVTDSIILLKASNGMHFNQFLEEELF